MLDRCRGHSVSTYVKSPSYTDDLIFFSNVLPAVLDQDDKKTQSFRFFLDKHGSYSTFDAVDNDSDTCWRTHQSLQLGEFFAIDFLQIQTNITFELTVAHSLALQKSLIMSVSLNGYWWIPYRSTNGIHVQCDSNGHFITHKILFNTARFNLGFKSFRYVAFNTSKISMENIAVCDFKLIKTAPNG